MFEFNQLQSFDVHNSYRLRLMIEQSDRETAWEKAQYHSNPISRYNADLNGACLKAFLNWLSEWLEGELLLQPSVWKHQDIDSIWEVVNGTAIKIGETRLVLIPSDEGELEELSVPQEWVDIPTWAADYYLAVQVNLDGDDDEYWMEVWGFTTHRQLKNEGRYSAGNYTYSLPIEELTESLTVMQITLGLNLQEEVPLLPSLSEVQPEKLLEIFSDLSVYSPRLKVPFYQWAAFLANDEFRQRLYERRLKPLVREKNLVERAKNYLQCGWEIFEEMIESLETLEPNLVYAIAGSERYRNGYSSKPKIPKLIELLQDSRNKGNQWRAAELLGHVELGNAEAIAALTHLLQTTQDDTLRRQAAVSLGKIDPKNSAVGVRIGKIIELKIRLDMVRIVLVVTLLPEESDRINVHLWVCPARSQTLPPNLELIVLYKDGKVFWQEKADTATDNLQYEFRAVLDDYFQVKVAWQGVNVTEDFTI
ncbi:hypothetical protein BCD67_01355 [Oscillatoriales cyanobacterium USR001]|nr:hypothetical protein BCD67_01355 [Oscillatoriales cyanobacterium USR001]